jgi:hypothetical protein
MSTNDPMAAVRQYIDGFNKGDAKVMAATFAVPGSILDGMPPHVWQGPTATQDWYRDVLVEGEQHTVLQIITSLWASHCTITSPATAPTWSFPRPWRSRCAASRLRNPAQSLRWRCASSPKGGA